VCYGDCSLCWFSSNLDGRLEAGFLVLIWLFRGAHSAEPLHDSGPSAGVSAWPFAILFSMVTAHCASLLIARPPPPLLSPR